MTSRQGTTETTLHHSGTQNKHIWTLKHSDRIEHYTAWIDYSQDLYNTHTVHRFIATALFRMIEG